MQQQQQEFEANLDTLRRMVAENARGDAIQDQIEGVPNGGSSGPADLPTGQITAGEAPNEGSGQ